MIIRYLLLSVKHLFVHLYFVTTVHFYVSTYMRLKKAKRKKTKIDDVKEIELKITKDKLKI